MENWKVGNRYTYTDDKIFFKKLLEHVTSLGFDVKFGVSGSGNPYFDIIGFSTPKQMTT